MNGDEITRELKRWGYSEYLDQVEAELAVDRETFVRLHARGIPRTLPSNEGHSGPIQSRTRPEDPDRSRPEDRQDETRSTEHNSD